MTTNLEMLKAVAAVYPDGWVDRYFNEKTGALTDLEDNSDILAKFIAVELQDADDGSEAIRRLEVAIHQLNGCINAIEKF